VQPIRILLVDDAVVVRRVLTDQLTRDPDLRVIGAAQNGVEGLKKLALRPDIVILDVEMPELDGLGALVEIRKREPKLPVVMFSSVTSKAAEATMKALAAGANDYVTKPSSQGLSLEQTIPELIHKIKLYVSAARRRADLASSTGTTFQQRKAPRTRPEIVLIGVSTGGPTALSAVLPQLSPTLRVPVVLVQHMPSALFTEALANSLNSLCTLSVKHASAGRALDAGTVWVAPGEKHTKVVRAPVGVIAKLTLDPPLNGTRPAVDALFISAAQVYGPAVLGVVLTGMGQDGLLGAEAIVKAGGSVIVQDEATSLIWGMPGAIARAGLASAVVPLSQVAREINMRVGVAAQELRLPSRSG